MSNMFTDISKRPIAMTDLETSGAVFGEHEILEIGLVLFDQHTFEIIDTLNIKIKPEHIENAVPAALERNGYKPENWIDAISYHYYPPGQWDKSLLVDCIVSTHDDVKAIMKKYGIEKPIYCTELGTTKFIGATNAERITYLKKVLVYGVILGWEALIYFCLDKAPMALKDSIAGYDVCPEWQQMVDLLTRAPIQTGYLQRDDKGQYIGTLVFEDGMVFSI